MELSALVEKVGRMNVYWQRHSMEWTDAEWLQRRKKLLFLTQELDEQIAFTLHRIEDYGWTLTADNQWKRLGEPDPPKRLTDEDRAAFPAFARAEAREAAQPELIAAAGDRAGWSPF